MDAEDLYLQDLFTGKDQFIVPVFQRRYSWGEEEWEKLWDDLSALLDSPLGEDEHFIGAFVSMSRENRPGARPKYLIIDGQQRFVTLALILCAIRDKVSKLNEGRLTQLPAEEADSLANLSDKIQDENLVDPYEEELEKYRIISRTEDREAMFGYLDGGAVDDEVAETSIGESYQFFFNKIDEMVGSRGPYALHELRQAIIEQLPLAMITAEEDENPYTIFETLNERGLDLEESDLIRNYVFMQLDLDEQDSFNENHWLPFERKFTGTREYLEEDLTRFYRVFLMRRGEYVKQNSVYDAFKNRIDQSPRELVDTLDYYSDLYLTIRQPDTADKKWLQEALERKQKLDIGTADALILNLLDRWKCNGLSKGDLQEAFEGLESFAIRRSICGYSTRGYYQIFPSSIKSIENDRVVDSMFEYLAGRGWPEDDEFRKAFVTFDLYSRESDKCRLVFETLQRDYEHKEPVELAELEIEHVLPQEIGDGEHGEAWKAMLGDDWEELHDEWKHTPGNLTLTGYNPELSNHKFTDKKDLFAESKIDLNDHFLEVNKWTPVEIRDRGEALARRVAELWPVPDVVTTDEEDEDIVRVSILNDGVPLVNFEDTKQIEVMASVIEHLIGEEALLERISLPYIPATGEGDRALMNSEPKHSDGTEMRRSRELSSGVYLFTHLNGRDKQRYLRGLARECGLVCRFDGAWPTEYSREI